MFCVCPRCHLSLTVAERTEGWCDACGSILPLDLRLGSCPALAAPSSTGPEPQSWFWHSSLLSSLVMAGLFVGCSAAALTTVGTKSAPTFSKVGSAIHGPVGHAPAVSPRPSSSSGIR
jgi:hypothetical protein